MTSAQVRAANHASISENKIPINSCPMKYLQPKAVPVGRNFPFEHVKDTYNIRSVYIPKNVKALLVLTVFR